MSLLTTQNLVKGIDGCDWLFLHRAKTDIAVRIPLLKPALEIIKHFNQDIDYTSPAPLLPVYANQKVNAYLKEIADCCNIHKNLTSHVGRRTFATTVLLFNGIPVETVSKLLGHTNIKTTQLYAKVVDAKVSREMEELDDKLSSDR